MNAVVLRNILIGGIVLMLGAAGVLIYFASDFLREETIKTTHAKIDAELSNQDIEKLKSLQRVLAENTSSIQKANQIVSESKQYQYQNQIISDINSYASQTGVEVIGYDFGATDEASKPKSPSSSSLPAISGVKTLNVSVMLKSPMPFDNYLKFVKAIEQNLTKMQVSGINLSPDSDNSSYVTNPSVILIVYVR